MIFSVILNLSVREDHTALLGYELHIVPQDAERFLAWGELKQLADALEARLVAIPVDTSRRAENLRNGGESLPQNWSLGRFGEGLQEVIR